jgi:transposase
MQGRHVYQPKLFVSFDIDSLVPNNHFLRKVDQILDLSFVRELTKSFYCSNNGRPSVDPELFFRIVLIGYFYNISSDRKLCEEVGYNLAYRWFCRLSLEDAVPDHSSLTRIRDRLGMEIFESFFHKIIGICNKYGLVKGERIITDSTLIEANAALDSLTAKDPELAKQESEAAKRIDMNAPLPSRKVSNDTHISKTDPDSSLAKKEGKPRSLKYKIHTSIDADSRVILDNKVTTGACHEAVVFIDRLEHIERKYNLSIKEAIADRAYGSAANIQSLESKGITAFIPLFSSRSGQAAKIEEYGFNYDKTKDQYKCPEGKYLKPTTRNGGTIKYTVKVSDCQGCLKENECLLKQERYSARRYILRSVHQDFYEKQLNNMQEPVFQSAMKERMWKIEGINAEAKQLHGLKRAKYRGLSKIQIQAYMTASVQNLKRLIASIISGYLRLNSYLSHIYIDRTLLNCFKEKNIKIFLITNTAFRLTY